MVREQGHGPSGWHTGGATGWADCQGEKTVKRVDPVLGRSQTSPIPLQTLERELQGQIHARILARERYDMMDGGAAAGLQDARLLCYSVHHPLFWCLGLPTMGLSGPCWVCHGRVSKETFYELPSVPCNVQLRASLSLLRRTCGWCGEQGKHLNSFGKDLSHSESCHLDGGKWRKHYILSLGNLHQLSTDMYQGWGKALGR